MSIRKLASAIAVVCAAALLVPVAAGAQTSPTQATSLPTVPVTGTSGNGKSFTGHYKVDHFVTRHGKSYALGTLTGKLGGHFVKRTRVAMPVTDNATGSTLPGSPAGTAAATCPILHLVLGPLHLNLLGLKVNLNTVVLNITAQSGPGNLLGNLLCSVANLLNGPPPAASELTGLLNVAQQLLATPSLLTL